jgi:hypothetical protein
MGAKHTPGPWGELETESSVYLDGCGGWQDIGTTKGRVLAIAVGYACSPRDDAEANARLIASAPELLEALQSIIDSLAEGFISETCIDAARAAIRKATGETS